MAAACKTEPDLKLKLEDATLELQASRAALDFGPGRHSGLEVLFFYFF